MFLIDKSHKVLAMNAPAEKIVGKGDGVSLRVDRLSIDVGQDSELFRDAVARIMAGNLAHKSLCVNRPSGAPSIRVTVAGDPREPRERDDVAIVLMHDEEERCAPDIQTLEDMFDLTNAEARVVAHLCTGLTLEQSSRQLGVAITTARTHLGRAMEKTGTHRQADLVRLVLRSVPAGLSGTG